MLSIRHIFTISNSILLILVSLFILFKIKYILFIFIFTDLIDYKYVLCYTFFNNSITLNNVIYAINY